MGNPNIIREFPWEVLRNQWVVPDATRYERSEQEVSAAAIGAEQCHLLLHFRN
ncbi:hypothetical protein GmarT_13210 [Gimesia maris]|uniref:Uncharacterized protein n=1 Tax=Gimesia maris TaxID=122 RepID=A0ABX5YII7_9PLAN|nr:hypothetical protein GmarT_13210 [Gimesia maris]